MLNSASANKSVLVLKKLNLKDKENAWVNVSITKEKKERNSI